MNLIEILFYKYDEETKHMRLSKTKVISSLVFILFFIFAIYTYLTTPTIKDGNIIISLLASIIVGLIFAIPTFVAGLLINKFLNRNKPNTLSNYDNNSNQMSTQNNINPHKEENHDKKECTNDFAKQFKEAVEHDDVSLASDILSKWDEKDANCQYALLIFEGMPPSTLSLIELENILKSAEKLNACDESLRDWFKSTALEVINLNK